MVILKCRRCGESFYRIPDVQGVLREHFASHTGIAWTWDDEEIRDCYHVDPTSGTKPHTYVFGKVS